MARTRAPSPKTACALPSASCPSARARLSPTPASSTIQSGHPDAIRAEIKRPRILIFDEATSSLDSRTEQAIQQTLAEVAEYHTTLVIAHRLSTVVDADHILVLEQGRIREQGTHRALLAAGGHYTAMLGVAAAGA